MEKRWRFPLKNQLERLTEKMTDMEDRCRRNNVRLVGLPEAAEGSDAAGFLRVNLSKWIPSLRGRDIEIERRILSAPCLSRSRMPQLCGGTTGEQQPLFLQPGERSLTAGMDMVLAAREGMMTG